MKVEKLETPGGNKSPEQVVIIDGEKIAFESYHTIICEYDKKTKKLKVFGDWNCSQTTMRYLWQFMQKYTPYKVSSKKEFERFLKNAEIVTLNEK